MVAFITKYLTSKNSASFTLLLIEAIENTFSDFIVVVLASLYFVAQFRLTSKCQRQEGSLFVRVKEKLNQKVINMIKFILTFSSVRDLAPAQL